jgi:hypothetical protein
MYQKDIYRVYIQEQIRQNICKIYVQGCPNKIECIPRVVHGWTYALTLTYFTYYELNLKKLDQWVSYLMIKNYSSGS